MSKVEEKVINAIRERAELGEKKYGVTMERKDLSVYDWLNHAQEEAMDLSIYLQKCKDEMIVAIPTDRVKEFLLDKLDLDPNQCTRQDLLDAIDIILMAQKLSNIIK